MTRRKIQRSPLEASFSEIKRWQVSRPAVVVISPCLAIGYGGYIAMDRGSARLVSTAPPSSDRQLTTKAVESQTANVLSCSRRHRAMTIFPVSFASDGPWRLAMGDGDQSVQRWTKASRDTMTSSNGPWASSDGPRCLAMGRGGALDVPLLHFSQQGKPRLILQCRLCLRLALKRFSRPEQNCDAKGGMGGVFVLEYIWYTAVSIFSIHRKFRHFRNCRTSRCIEHWKSSIDDDYRIIGH